MREPLAVTYYPGHRHYRLHGVLGWSYLSDLTKLVLEGHRIKVTEHGTGTDLTRTTLAQALVEVAERLPSSVLHELVRAAVPTETPSSVITDQRTAITN